ncbi:hypothetical protein L248_1687 [Schleiferilactobacillus shenzhenensis LY-73]|uniref:Uncharacterized protein n=1 Tax=Schleiferilactobacillus shenzhenensis LY-73 TaxID=1231336 RepID=U4TIM6_9LACO|nr:hypothetical protein L248_1687 [Schleiferilactobacillus shenzhenensis LY-73]
MWRRLSLDRCQSVCGQCLGSRFSLLLQNCQITGTCLQNLVFTSHVVTSLAYCPKQLSNFNSQAMLAKK